MKKFLPILTIALATAQLATAQTTTVTFKPGPAQGQDAILINTYGCAVDGSSTPSETQNFGNTKQLNYMAWSMNSVGCDSSLQRSVIRFAGLSNIPSDAAIVSAELRLYGISDPSTWGNSSFPGSPFNTTNEGWVRRITSPWTESTVTWNNQPTTTTSNQVSIPESTAKYNWNVNLDVTNMVQDMVTLNENHGFLLRLQEETTLRKMVVFASSDYLDTLLRPELFVEYTTCNAAFSYMGNTEQSNILNFTANEEIGTHKWYVDNVQEGSGINFTHQFPGAGTYKICHTVSYYNTKCTECIKICIPNIIHVPPMIQTSDTNDNLNEVQPELANNLFYIKSASPNPTDQNWHIEIEMRSERSVLFEVYDQWGKQVYQKRDELNKGSGSHSISAKDWPTGLYILKVKSDNEIQTIKLMKQ